MFNYRIKQLISDIYRATELIRALLILGPYDWSKVREATIGIATDAKAIKAELEGNGPDWHYIDGGQYRWRSTGLYNCKSCNRTTHIVELDSPECPHCGEQSLWSQVEVFNVDMHYLEDFNPKMHYDDNVLDVS